MSQSLLRVPAPAKLNLFLHIIGRRSDGYHLLQSVFTFIDLCDYLDFTLRTDGVIYREGSSLEGLAADDDLIVRAAKLLQETTGSSFGATIACEKNIPAGAGLGGGSSDAATTLIALNRLWKTGLSRQQLMELGLRLGADVPIFIFGQSAFAEGIGEQLQPVSLPNLYYLLVKPTSSVATPALFSDEGLTRNKPQVIITDFTGYAIKPDSQRGDSIALFGENVMQPIACKYAADIQSAFDLLRNKKLHARMTGSGSTFFVAFADKKETARQVKAIYDIVLLEQPAMQNKPSIYMASGLNFHPLYNWLTDFGD